MLHNEIRPDSIWVFFAMLPKIKVLIIISCLSLFLGIGVSSAFAQNKTATSAANPANTGKTTAQAQGTTPPYIPLDANVAPEGAPLGQSWHYDPEVQVTGLNATRALDFLDWVLLHGTTPPNKYGPIVVVYQVVQKATFAFALLIVIGVGFMLIIRRNKDISLMRFLPMFLILLAYVFLSFAITRGIYQLTEVAMHVFLRIPDTVNGGYKFITSENLLDINFVYDQFVGLRRTGPSYDESAITTLMLTRATIWTYMAMSGILVIRQIILWFFIILSPFLALLIPFPLLRNTAKIWIGEFFRWLMYGLLFAIFLHGLVIMWQHENGIPMSFIPDTPATNDNAIEVDWDVLYPTSTSILLAGPNYHNVTGPEESGGTNHRAAYTSVNNIDTYANYVIALIMLWAVIILPWILLKVFRDMVVGFLKSEGANNLFNQLGSLYMKLPPNRPSGSPFSPAPASPSPAPQAPRSPSPAGTGRTLELPFRKVNIVARDVAVNQDIKNNNIVNIDRQISQAATQEMTKLLGVSLPKITDIARMEMNSARRSQQWSTLQKLGNPNLASNPIEMQKISALRSELTKRANSGDERAKTMLQAANSAAAVTASTMSSRAANAATINNQILAENAARGAAAIAAATASVSNPNQASKIVNAARNAGGPGANPNSRIMPVVNRVQSVSLNDYEEVKNMWKEHYVTSDIPPGANVKSKKEWIQQDIEKAETAITLIGNINPDVKQKGLEMVAVLLPFLLLGGFSEQETIAYMKAKVEAAKQVLNELEAQEKGKKEGAEEAEEETLKVNVKKDAAQTEQHMEAQIEEEKPDMLQGDSLGAEVIENKAAEASFTSHSDTN